MVNEHNEHVVTRGNGWWAVKHETGEKATRLFDNEHDAIEFARAVAKKHNACVIVHNGHGKFRFVQCREEIPSATQITEVEYPVLNNLNPIIQKIDLI